MARKESTGEFGRDREEFFDGAGVAVEIFLEDGGLFGVGDGLEGERLAVAGALEEDFVGGFGVADPLGAASGGDEDFLAGDLHEVDGRAIEFAGFAAADFELVDEAGGQAEAGEEAEGAVEEGFEWVWRLIFRRVLRRGHRSNPNCLTGARAISFHGEWATVDRSRKEWRAI